MGRVDFRDQIGVYVLFDKDMLPTYVGQAGNGYANLFTRLKSHAKGQLWNRWDYFSWFGLRRVNANGSLSKHDSAKTVYKPSGAAVLNQLEGILIAVMEPKLNKQRAKFAGAYEFSQAIDENIEDLTLKDIKDQVTDLHEAFEILRKSVSKKQA